MNYSFTLRSHNGKTGPIPVTASHRGTCPARCPYLKDSSCYAEAGWYTRMHWDKLDSGERGGDWDYLCGEVAALPLGTLWRHNISGDLPKDRAGLRGAVDWDMVWKLTEANAGKRGFTYTHHDMRLKYNRLMVREMNLHGFTVNISTDSPADADAAYALNIGPVVCVVPSAQTTNFKTPAGREVVICPATQRDDVTCATCALCAVTHRETIVGFPAHGAGKRKTDFIVEWQR